MCAQLLFLLMSTTLLLVRLGMLFFCHVHTGVEPTWTSQAPKSTIVVVKNLSENNERSWSNIKFDTENFASHRLYRYIEPKIKFLHET